MMNVEFQAQVLKDRSFEILALYNSVDWAEQMKTSSTLINAPPGSVLDAHMAPHRGAFCQFPFRWIYYYGSNESTGKETGKTHLCVLL